MFFFLLPKIIQFDVLNEWISEEPLPRPLALFDTAITNAKCRPLFLHILSNPRFAIEDTLYIDIYMKWIAARGLKFKYIHILESTKSCDWSVLDVSRVESIYYDGNDLQQYEKSFQTLMVACERLTKFSCEIGKLDDLQWTHAVDHAIWSNLTTLQMIITGNKSINTEFVAHCNNIQNFEFVMHSGAKLFVQSEIFKFLSYIPNLLSLHLDYPHAHSGIRLDGNFAATIARMCPNITSISINHIKSTGDCNIAVDLLLNCKHLCALRIQDSNQQYSMTYTCVPETTRKTIKISTNVINSNPFIAIYQNIHNFTEITWNIEKLLSNSNHNQSIYTLSLMPLLLQNCECLEVLQINGYLARPLPFREMFQQCATLQQINGIKREECI